MSNMRPGETCPTSGHVEPPITAWRRLRLQAEAALGGECAECHVPSTLTAESPMSARANLQIDHVDGVTYYRNKGGLTMRDCAQGRTEGKQLLCTTCHRAKTTADRREGRADWRR